MLAFSFHRGSLLQLSTFVTISANKNIQSKSYLAMFQRCILETARLIKIWNLQRASVCKLSKRFKLGTVLPLMQLSCKEMDLFLFYEAKKNSHFFKWKESQFLLSMNAS